MIIDIDLSEVPCVPALVGVAGSHAFGMATVTSDVDLRGVYVTPTRELFRLVTPPETYAHTDPDISLHEVGKFLRMACAANPHALEALFYSEYVVKNEIGGMLLANREAFITGKIRDTHLGFARSQFEKLKKRNGSFSSDTAKRTSKHARHTLRVLRLAEKVLATGNYDLIVENPDEIFTFGSLEHTEMCVRAQREIDRVEAMPSVLPPAPDLVVIDDLLIRIREMSLNE